MSTSFLDHISSNSSVNRVVQDSVNGRNPTWMEEEVERGTSKALEVKLPEIGFEGYGGEVTGKETFQEEAETQAKKQN